MSFRFIPLYLALLSVFIGIAQHKIEDAETGYPVSYATISFNNGLGLFADDKGEFMFSSKLYPEIDTLYISALGYKDLNIATADLPSVILMDVEIDALEEVLITTKSNRKYKTEDIKPYLDDDYYHCWLPTIESEIAVFFQPKDAGLKKLSNVHFPITLESKDWGKRKRSNADKKPFSTLFKAKFYNVENGYPGKEIILRNIVFRVTEQNGDEFILDVTEEDIFIPDTGIFISLQVLGYTDANGKLLTNKKYKEIKSREGGIIRIPTNFRPLLPFTDKIAQNKTFIKRVFLNRNAWTIFQKGNNIQSTLLQSNLNNYGMGITYKIYKD